MKLILVVPLSQLGRVILRSASTFNRRGNWEKGRGESDIGESWSFLRQLEVEDLEWFQSRWHKPLNVLLMGVSQNHLTWGLCHRTSETTVTRILQLRSTSKGSSFGRTRMVRMVVGRWPPVEPLMAPAPRRGTS